ncbi:TMV resistance protein N-like [Carya illinoinensis]|uniref:TMV resistance protein N-like n=1 Tax=Carya illinoinensis TaxID=32201 RepID=UPI001C71B733|nr:TMV resistance protein N-like [Carya illinoinensis]
MAFMTTSTDKTALPSSSSSSPTRWKYDVFLSFHGEDTRKSFTAHLYTALEQKGIFTFRDDEKLERGQYISLELLKAIKESKYAIIVFSINYAFSNWCLIELAKIAECMKENRLIVFPVFYHVDPSHIRNQKGTFAEAFVKHGEDPNIHIKKIQTWRAALEEVGNIAGWHLHDRDESTAIKEIIETILSQLNRTCLSISGKLFGIDSPVDQMIKNLHRKNSDGVCFVGICGMGGIGKTTLAEVVFNRIRNQFQATSFIDCVREKSIGYHGLISLQKQLLSQILEEEKINIQDVREGMNMIKNRLFSRKVLIILDDVDKEQQLEALTGNHDWFGPGSRIIITSRDRHLLKRHVDYIYMATVLGHANAMQLFCWKAFKNPYPKENYVDLCKDFVEYANGLPLALKVLGSSLYDRGTNEWESARDKLKENPNREVLDILEIGFHSLGVAERKLFLDIACFFKREIKKDLIIDLLESSDYPPHIDVAILVDKSLLTVCDGNSFSMHDLLQEMGKEIVQRESPEVPGRRSRLWLLEDALETLSNNTVSAWISQGINLENSYHLYQFLKHLQDIFPPYMLYFVLLVL